MSLAISPALRDALERWLAHLAALNDASDHTVAAYRGDVAQFLDFLARHHGGTAGMAQLRAVDSRDLRAWMAQARASGLRVGLLHYGLLTALSLTIVATLSSVGLILAVALLVTPGAIAFLVVRSFGWMLVVSVAVCTMAMLAGTYASFFLDSAPAATVVLILTAIFILAFLRRLHVTRKTSRRMAGTRARPSPR